MLQPDPARFASPQVLVNQALEALEIAEPISVSEAAERHYVLNNPGGGYSGPFTFDRVEFLRRPMDCLQMESGYSRVAVMGPAQTFKSTLGNAWLVHTVVCDPADMIVVFPDKDTLADYSASQIKKVIEESPDVKRRQLHGAGSNNLFRKEFAGCTVFFKWPVASQLRARPLPRWRVDDLDAIAEDIDGEGNVLTLLSGRQATFEGYEMGFANSSPARGADRGIEALVVRGTDERWTVDCLHCDAPFVLAALEVLDYDQEGTVEDARKSAAVVCPDCGGLHHQADKARLMARGRWVGVGQTAVPGGVIGALLPNTIASFRFDGLMGARSWPAIAAALREAELTFEATQDEGELRGVVNTWCGCNFTSRHKGVAPVTAEELAERAGRELHRLGEVPEEAQCLTAAVDVQGNRFEVMVQAWGAGFESWVVDRFALLALDGRTAIDPGRHPEHWGALLENVIWRKYPMAGSAAPSVPILTTAIDTGGVDGVTENAKAFWHTALRAGVKPFRLTMIKGGNNPNAALLPAPRVDSKRASRKKVIDVPIFVPNVHRFKDVIDVRLHRDETGPGCIHWPVDIEQRHLQEATAERKENGLWARLPGRANESWDLLVYNAAALTRAGGADASMRWVPHWARPGGAPEAAAASPAPGPSLPQNGRPAPAPLQPSPFRRSGLWQ